MEIVASHWADMSPAFFPAISSLLFHALLRCLSWAQQFGTSRVTVSRPPHHLGPIMYHLTQHSPHPFEHRWCGFAARGKIQAPPVMKLEHMTHSGFSFFFGPTSCRQITNNITHKAAQIFTLQGEWSRETYLVPEPWSLVHESVVSLWMSIIVQVQD